MRKTIDLSTMAIAAPWWTGAKRWAVWFPGFRFKVPMPSEAVARRVAAAYNT